MGARLPSPPPAGGLFDALRAIGATLADMACVRGALASVELREEIERRKQLLVLAIGGAVFLHTALLLLTVAVAAFFWDTHRMAALGTMIALYLAAGAGLFLSCGRTPPPRPNRSPRRCTSWARTSAPSTNRNERRPQGSRAREGDSAHAIGAREAQAATRHSARARFARSELVSASPSSVASRVIAAARIVQRAVSNRPARKIPVASNS
jgi:uncharacterized membrane protein YqjE